MKPISDLTTRAGLMDRWMNQIGDRLEHGFERRPLAIVRWSSRFPTESSLIDIRMVRATVLFDRPATTGPPRIRVATYCCRAIPEGVHIGGAAQLLYDKDLARRPYGGARGSRINAADIPLLRGALLMDARISASSGTTTPFSKRLRLPKIWAAFEPAVADRVRGSGPELFGLCHSRGQSSAELLKRFRRSHNGLVLFPHEWVSDFWRQARTILADFTGVPRVQILDCARGFDELCGYRSACEFDLLGSRFASTRRSSSAPLELVVAG